MPAVYSTPDQEVESCRNHAAVFDYSFLLVVEVRGEHALDRVSALCGRNLNDLAVGRIAYALTTDQRGHLVSDLTVWRLGPKCLQLMSGRTADDEVFRDTFDIPGVELVDLSNITAVIAVQGPAAVVALQAISSGYELASTPRFGFRDLHVCGVSSRVARLGFTGLDGFEIVCPVDHAQSVWEGLARSCRCAGFEAADRLRLHAGLPLFSREFQPPVNAADAGLFRFRPAGVLTAEQRAARVKRVSFECRRVSGTPQNLDAACWQPGDPFPPADGDVAITSLTTLDVDGGLIGMGYVTPATGANDLRDPKRRVQGIEIHRG